MQTRNPFIDDLTKVANGAMGALTATIAAPASNPILCHVFI